MGKFIHLIELRTWLMASIHNAHRRQDRLQRRCRRVRKVIVKRLLSHLCFGGPRFIFSACDGDMITGTRQATWVLKT